MLGCHASIVCFFEENATMASDGKLTAVLAVLVG